ncbi:solute carrier family 25 (mitochondrial S-adenosylmethionine transporter), member 26 [Strigomonas culicis]|uniref:Solute carrier family 25 (Mitochondrial S-adenosylmethionine transporter), member 26 n=1 Tax=Strigomonas culicis TaxID=28005 RepID=S9TJ26_9TRYP|nr:solute carrier family 25 (mitochondrial S-adenosylmethionine transporter), member 26 [Strigomonas culicis]|eukprot:EPY16388.1 solute carrier family 25 (mitochondrial S-adenosylmethionine transporter), member 26 [Strigomonas culicis]
MSAHKSAYPIFSATTPALRAESFLTSFTAAVTTLPPSTLSFSQHLSEDATHLEWQLYDVSSYRLPTAVVAVLPAVAAAHHGSSSSATAAVAAAADDTTAALRASGVAAAASCATIVAKSLLHPLDTLKCRMQLYEPPRGAGAVGWWHGLREAYAGRWGATALYGGLAIKVLLYVPYQAVYMCSYNAGREWLQVEAARHGDSHGAYVSRTAAAAIIAELGSCVVRVPMETIKMWVQSTASANTMAAARRLRRGGLRSCLRLALPQTMLHDIPYSVTQWITYETLRPWARRLPNDGPTVGTGGRQTFWQCYSADLLRTFVSGGFSGLIASALTVPLDTLRTRMVVTAAHAPGVTLPALVRRVYAVEGVRGFFKGGSMRVLWVTANMAVYFPLFEFCKTVALNHQQWRDSHPPRRLRQPLRVAQHD